MERQRLASIRKDRQGSRSIRRILFENGYNDGYMATWRSYSAPVGIALVLTYLDERSAIQVNAVVKRSNLPVRLIFRPPATLKEILISSRLYENGCDVGEWRYCRDQRIRHLRGTVYLITCSRCGQRYRGETGRPLKKRLDEHRRAFSCPQSYPNNAFSKHRTMMHTRESTPTSKSVLHRHPKQPMAVYISSDDGQVSIHCKK